MEFKDLFRGYTRSHGQSQPKGTKDARGKLEFAHFVKPGFPSDQQWEAHLNGKGNGLGIIPLMDDNVNVMWGAIDIDKYPLDHVALEKQIEPLPLTLTKSKSGGAHLWLFLKEPTSAALVMRKLGEWSALLGYGGCEVFPKQHTRTKIDDVGNWINLPYYGHTRQCFFEGQNVELAKFLEVAAARTISAAQLEAINVIQDTEGLFSDGAPCLQMIFQAGVSQGSRNNALFCYGVYFKLRYPEEWREKLHQHNRTHFDPSLPEKEVSDMVKSLEGNDNFNYMCDREPMKSFCNRPLCLKRDYGISRGGGDAELNVTLTGLTKIDTSVPRYLINIDGIRADIGGAETLANQAKFGLICIDKVAKFLNPIPNNKWRETIGRLLENQEVVSTPFDASPEGQFYLYLKQFIENRSSNEDKDVLAKGNVWLDSGFAYFRSPDLFQFLRREGFRDLPQSKLFSLLHDIGLEKGRFNIKGSTIAWWRVALDKISSLQTQPFDVPTFGDEVFGDASGKPKP